MVKRSLVFSIAIFLFMGLTVAVYADSVNQGSEFKVKISVNSSAAGTANNNIYLFFDTSAFSYVKSVGMGSASESTPELTKAEITGGELNGITDGKTGSLLGIILDSKTGEVIEVTLKVKENAEINNYGIDAYGVYGKGTSMNATVSPTAVEVIKGSSASDPVQTTPPYTVTATAPATSAIGEDVNVGITLTSGTVGASYAALQTGLTYDANKFTFVSGTYSTGITATDSTPAGTITVTRVGTSQSIGNDGETAVTLTFTAKAAGSADFTIVNPKVGRADQTFPTEVDAATAGAPASVTVSAQTATVTAYAGAPTGFALLKYAVQRTDTGYKYSGQDMYWSSKQNAYLYIVADSVTGDAAMANIAAGTANANLAYDGEVNGVAGVDVFDAQTVYDLTRGDSAYRSDTGFATLSVKQRLEADINGDGALTTADAYAVQHYIHYGSFEIPSSD
jgi:hypothetical protein